MSGLALVLGGVRVRLLLRVRVNVFGVRPRLVLVLGLKVCSRLLLRFSVRVMVRVGG